MRSNFSAGGARVLVLMCSIAGGMAARKYHHHKCRIGNFVAVVVMVEC